MAKLWIGNISPDVREDDMHKEFGRFGRISRLDFKGKFAYLLYEDSSSASDAIREMHRRDFMGSSLVVEISRDDKERGHNNDRFRQPKKNRLIVSNLDSRTSWQDLKDWARNAGSVSFTNAFFRDGAKVGIVEYDDFEDMDEAIPKLEKIPLHGMDIRVERDSGDSGFRPTTYRGGDGGGRGGGGYSGDSRRSPPRRYLDEYRRPSYESGGGGYPSRGHPGGDRDMVGGGYRADDRGGGGGYRGRPPAAYENSGPYDRAPRYRSRSRDRTMGGPPPSHSLGPTDRFRSSEYDHHHRSSGPDRYDTRGGNSSSGGYPPSAGGGGRDPYMDRRGGGGGSGGGSGRPPYDDRRY